MRDLMSVLLVSAAALGGILIAVVLAGDVTTAVPPPESVAEQFARQIATRRYDRALQHVDSTSGITLITVRLGGDAFHSRAGSVDNVEGEPGEIRGDDATASAVLITEREGRMRFNYRLKRTSGVWKIVEWDIN